VASRFSRTSRKSTSFFAAVGFAVAFAAIAPPTLISFATNGSLPPPVAVTTTRSPAFSSASFTAVVPRRILVLSFSVMVDCLPSAAFTSTLLSCTADSVPMIL
jgi:hypothetical protein